MPVASNVPPTGKLYHSVTEPVLGIAVSVTEPKPQRIPGVIVVKVGGLQSVLKSRIWLHILTFPGPQLPRIHR